MEKIDIILGTMTMNAGDDIFQSPIKFLLKNNFTVFKRVIVFDGNLTNNAKEFYKTCDNVEVVNYPWDDNYGARYKLFAEEYLKEQEWGMWLDDDECLTEDLYKWLSNSISDLNKKGVQIVGLPCILHITEDGKFYYPVEPKPPKVYSPEIWVKWILFKKTQWLQFRCAGSHVIPYQSKDNVWSYSDGCAYVHLKSFESFVYNDVWQGFLCPEGQQYTSVEAAQFKLFTSKYKSVQAFKQATVMGEWPEPLKRFAWNSRWITERPISRLAWTYFLLYGHSCLEKDEKFTWENVKKYILKEESIKLLQKNKKEGNYIRIE